MKYHNRFLNLASNIFSLFQIKTLISPETCIHVGISLLPGINAWKSFESCALEEKKIITKTRVLIYRDNLASILQAKPSSLVWYFRLFQLFHYELSVEQSRTHINKT